MDRKEAISLVKKYVKKENLVKHMIATGAVMRHLARHFGENEELWELAGILHDIDYEKTCNKPDKHGIISIEILKKEGVNNVEIHDAILAHCNKKEHKTLIEKCIYAADPVTGFIVACALMHPTKSLRGLDLKFLKKRFKEKRFAAGANRDQMRSIEKVGMTLDEFLSLSLKAMQEISEELGL